MKTITKYISIVPIVIVLALLLLFKNQQTTAQETLKPVSYLPIILNPSAPLAAVQITHIHYNDPRNDTTGNKEWLWMTNESDFAQDMTGWSLSSEAGETYIFPNNYELAAGKGVRVWTKSGENSQNNLYWGLVGDVWKADGDTATLKDNTGTIIDECVMPGKTISVDC